MPLSPIEIFVACLAITCGAFVQGSIGFGMSLAASPILLLLEPRLVPAPLIISGMVLTTSVAIRDRQNIRLDDLRFGFPGLIIGSAGGALLLAMAPTERLPLALGLLVLLAVLLSVAGLAVDPRPRNIFLGTILAGFMSTTASIPGPALALLYQRAAPSRFRAALAPLLLTGNVVSLAALGTAGRLGPLELELGLILIPAALVGFGLSRFGVDALPVAHARAAVLTLSTIAGIAAVFRGWP